MKEARMSCSDPFESTQNLPLTNDFGLARHVGLVGMAGQGPLTIREVARRVQRDVKAVHGDVHALIDAGLLQKTETSRVAFPFDAIRVEFTLRAA